MVSGFLELQHLRAGTKATVAKLGGKALAVARLAEMGVTLGARIEVLRPGSPCIFKLEDTCICLRLEPDLKVLVSQN